MGVVALSLRMLFEVTGELGTYDTYLLAASLSFSSNGIQGVASGLTFENVTLFT